MTHFLLNNSLKLRSKNEGVWFYGRSTCLLRSILLKFVEGDRNAEVGGASISRNSLENTNYFDWLKRLYLSWRI